MIIEAVNVSVIAETPEVLVVNKPEGVSTIAERDPAQSNLRQLLEGARHERLFVVHRLDKEVSGALVFARTAAAHRELCLQFEQRSIEKTYLAVVRGTLAAESGTIDAKVREFGSGRMGVDPRGKPSRSDYSVLARSAGHTLLEVTPVTGRRHQIRVHLYSIGHTVAGETRYGEGPGVEEARLMLHAWRLALPAFSSSPAQRLEAAPPPSFVRELERLGLSLPERR
ncbi:MAG TPA: RNA pseudouridine synthase [Polyangiaceae bacterium]|nr:RNA pseudouridine synthase [Polyangiaceae bacterium]